MTNVKLVSVTPDAEKLMAYCARVSNPLLFVLTVPKNMTTKAIEVVREKFEDFKNAYQAEIAALEDKFGTLNVSIEFGVLTGVN